LDSKTSLLPAPPLEISSTIFTYSMFPTCLQENDAHLFKRPCMICC
jgi:hypothetical protein